MTTTATEPSAEPSPISPPISPPGPPGSSCARAHPTTRLNTPRDAAGLAAFRILFGALMVGAVVRFVAKGWVEELYLAPQFHFTYLGFEWVRPWPPLPWLSTSGMYLHFGVMGLAALGLLLGAWTRASALLFFLSFTYAELIDKTVYLNHYYFVSLLALLLAFVPAGATWSVDAWRRGAPAPVTVPAWSYALLRAQVGLVYVFAGLAKCNADWLLRAEPLRTWLQAYTDLPIVGAFIGQTWVAYAMSWAGALYDLFVVAFFLSPRTRRFAYTAAVAFHLAIWCLFPIGIFSWVMLASTTLFFDPSWPRRLGAGRLAAPSQPASPTAPAAPSPSFRLGFGFGFGALGATVAALYLGLQVLIPLRFVLYPGNVNWTEEGFRFAWRVMLVEKSGQVEFEVVTHNPPRRWVVYPRSELTPLQYKMMSTQPDMIHEYALHLAERYRRQGYPDVEVRAQAWAALNGRPSQRLIDPTIDLAREPRSLRPKSWIVPLGSSCPPSGATLSSLRCY